MPVLKEVLYYTFSELSDHQKEMARERYRCHDTDYDWYTSVYDDFLNLCSLIGIEIGYVSRSGSGTKRCLWFSGFYSQGDGACFEGVYKYRKGALKKVTDAYPMDKELHEIIRNLQNIQKKFFYRLKAEITHRGRYYHENSMDIRVCNSVSGYLCASPNAEAIIETALRSLALWFYNQLEKEYDYITSDEVVDAALEESGAIYTEK